MKMKSPSFRIIIIATLVLMISLLSLVSFAVFNLYLKSKLESHIEQNFNQMNLLKDQYYFTISQHDGRIIKSMLKSIENDKNVVKTYIVNAGSKVVYPEDYSSLKGDTLSFKKLFDQDKDITIKTYSKEKIPIVRVFMTMRNTPACYACHAPSQKNAGMIVMDLANQGSQGIIHFTRQFGIYYTLFILLCIFGLVAFLHVRFIKRSLHQFRTTISMINKGNLDMRLAIPEVRELGGLGKDFNEMVTTFEKTQKELQVYHQKEMENSQKLATIGEMSARIAHEIRNPVTGIARAMEIIIADMKDNDNKPVLEEIQRQANRVNQAISNLLRFSRSKDLSLEMGNINDIIKSLVFFLKNQAHEKVVRFEMSPGENVPLFLFDMELIENALMNLCFNAMQALPDDGVIRFSTFYDQRKHLVLISVSDNGSGIPNEVGKDIFKPFYTTRTQGTGLGLAITKDIIDKHKGELWYENNTGPGCTFFISLPV
jgi:two-component system, NtrC family, sensor kinase